MRCLPLLALVPVLASGMCPAQETDPRQGLYCGIVFFDRWDSCYLYSGTDVMYVEGAARAALRAYAGQCLTFRATDIVPLRAYGEAVIRALTVEEPTPDAPGEYPGSVLDVSLKAEMRLREGKPEFRLRLRNERKHSRLVWSDALGPTLLMRAPQSSARGGSRSLAVSTGWDPCVSPTGSSSPQPDRTIYWRVTSGPVPFEPNLAPGQELAVDVLFSLPPGKYRFLCGYGGLGHATRCLASNTISVNVDARRVARPVQQR